MRGATPSRRTLCIPTTTCDFLVSMDALLVRHGPIAAQAIAMETLIFVPRHAYSFGFE
jgi:hypothetical protein